jgi:hypothetical protein
MPTQPGEEDFSIDERLLMTGAPLPEDIFCRAACTDSGRRGRGFAWGGGHIELRATDQRELALHGRVTRCGAVKYFSRSLTLTTARLAPIFTRTGGDPARLDLKYLYI